MKLWLAAVAIVMFALALRAGGPAPLEDAIERGDIEGARAALDEGADPNGRNESQSPLTFAILKHAPDVKASSFVKLLVSREADVNQAADLRPLYAAILKGDVVLTQFLVSAGANADVAGCVRATMPGSTEGETAKQLAAKKGEPFTSIVAGARPSPKVEPRKTELKRTTLCSH